VWGAKCKAGSTSCRRSREGRNRPRPEQRPKAASRRAGARKPARLARASRRPLRGLLSMRERFIRSP
jgi:hypothetical protein